MLMVTLGPAQAGPFFLNRRLGMLRARLLLGASSPGSHEDVWVKGYAFMEYLFVRPGDHLFVPTMIWRCAGRRRGQGWPQATAGGGA
jgi:hypothetical protein